MKAGGWEIVLVAGLALNAALGLGYRVYRLTNGGPIADVWGQAVLAGILALVAVLIGAEIDWARWVAAVYAFLFALVVMPVWTLAVLLPMRPGALDYSFTALYWVLLVVIAVGAIAL